MENNTKLPETKITVPDGREVITLGAGCFWCTEAVFQRIEGVENVVSGYAGGFVVDPTYEDVCNGTTGHAEVVQVFFHPAKITISQLLEIFWATHDPTTLNRQGADQGPQYRSAIYFHTPEQEKIATELKSQINASKVFDKPIVTEITQFSNFYPAETHHQDYFNLNDSQPYCQFVVKPKVDKLKKFFSDKLKA